MYSDYRQVQHYLAHFGIKGQSWYTRHFQSYETAPTRSGKVGQEVGLAAKHGKSKYLDGVKKRFIQSFGATDARAKLAKMQSDENAKTIAHNAKVESILASSRQDAYWNEIMQMALNDFNRGVPAHKVYSEGHKWASKEEVYAADANIKAERLTKLYKNRKLDKRIVEAEKNLRDELSKNNNVYFITNSKGDKGYDVIPKEAYGDDPEEYARWHKFYSNRRDFKINYHINDKKGN